MKRKKNILEKTETVKEKQIESLFYRLIFIGDTMVGKTQIINRYINDLYSEEYFPTFSIDFKIKTIKINGKTINIHCIDTEGLSNFSIDTGPLFIEKTDAFIYVFDITSRESFYNLNTCNDIIRSTLTDYESIIRKKIIYLVGNKCDLDLGRQVNEFEGKEEADKYNAKYIEVSAKNGKNIDRLFDYIIQDINDNNKKNNIIYDDGGGIKFKTIHNNKINTYNNDVKINNNNNNNNNNINTNTNFLESENPLDYDNSSFFLKTKKNENNKSNNNDYVKNINNFYLNNNNNKESQSSNFYSNYKFNKCQIF